MNPPIPSPIRPVRRHPARRGFTLIELMVACTVFSMLLIIVFQLMRGMQVTWKRVRQDTGEFKEARQGFEEISRRVTQATLNTYFSYRYDEKLADVNGVKMRVGREIIPQSELHFVCGPVDQLEITQQSTLQVGQRHSHAIFFQAPFGFCINEDKKLRDRLRYEKMQSLMNGWGYYVEFNTDELDRPQLLKGLTNSPKPRPRYRLMEFRQPTEYLQVYKLHLRDLGKDASKSHIYKWFSEGYYSVNSVWNTSLEDRASEGFFRSTRVLAENIIAMILRPREADEKRDAGEDEIAPDYHFDSRRFQWDGDGRTAARTKHQLPPVIDVTFVVVTESSFNAFCAREDITHAGDDPLLVGADMFKKVEAFRMDLKALEDKLTQKKLDYRIFNTSLRIRESKWTEKERPLLP